MRCSVWQITSEECIELVGRYAHPADARRVLRTAIQRGAAFDDDGELLDERGLKNVALARIESRVAAWLATELAPEAPTMPAPPEVCPSPTLPPPATVPAPTTEPAGLFDGPPEIVRDLRTPVLYALPGRRVDELATLRARVAELEAIAAEASRTADAAARVAEALALRLSTAEATAEAATAALTHALAHNDRLSGDLRRQSNSPRVVAELARTEAAPRKVRLAPKPTHPIAALKEHLRRRSR